MYVHVCAKHRRAGVEAAVNFFGAETRRSRVEAPKKLTAAETPALLCWAHTCTCTTPKMSRDWLNSLYDWRHSLGIDPRSIRTFLYCKKHLTMFALIPFVNGRNIPPKNIANSSYTTLSSGYTCCGQKRRERTLSSPLNAHYRVAWRDVSAVWVSSQSVWAFRGRRSYLLNSTFFKLFLKKFKKKF